VDRAEDLREAPHGLCEVSGSPRAVAIEGGNQHRLEHRQVTLDLGLGAVAVAQAGELAGAADRIGGELAVRLQAAEDPGDQGACFADEQVEVDLDNPLERGALDHPDQPGLGELVEGPALIHRGCWRGRVHASKS
jgi:hypothetical protein